MRGSDESLRSWPSHAAAGPSRSMFPQALLDVLASHPDLPAFEHGPRVVTCGEVLDIVRRLVAGFERAGVGPGAGVAMLTSVTPEAFAAYIAAFTVGCRVVGVSPGYSPVQRAHVLGADIDAAVVDDATRAGDAPGIVLSLGPVDGAIDVLATGEGAALTVRARRDDVARVVFTSGSTGLPKGCMQTYQAMSARWAWQPHGWSAEIAALAAGYDRYLLSGTMASPVILDQVALCLIAGGTAVIPTGDLSALLPHGFQRYRISAAIIPVPRLYAVLDAVATGGVDLGSVKALTVSGSPVGVRRFAEAVDRLGPVVYNAYGQTEAGPISMLTPADVQRFGEAAMTTVGRPYPGVVLEIRADGRPAGPDEVGDVVVSTPTMMSGYWRDPDRTAEVLAGGWLRTRDLGHVDGNGLLHLAGRTRDVIIVNAQITYAGPIEEVLSRHPNVREAHVLGTPDDTTGEAIHAFVVPAGDREPDNAELADLVRDELGALSVPSTITVVRDVPQTVTGKPDKRALLAMQRTVDS